jgi:hypothetical protein
MLTVPGVVVTDVEPARVYSLVLGMIADNPMARWADAALGFGYRKYRGSFIVDGAGGWTVSSSDRRRLMSVVSRSSSQFEPTVDLARIDAALQYPLLGIRRDGGFVRSWLRRSLFQPGLSVRPIAASLDVVDGLFGGLLPGRLDIPPYAAGGDGALEFSNLEAAVSYPSPVEGVA